MAGVNFGDAFLYGVLNGVSAGALAYVAPTLASKISEWTPLNPAWSFIAAHSSLSGVTSVLRGGRFGHGFASSFLSLASGYYTSNSIAPNTELSWQRVAIKSVSNGTISRISGGKFANGALSGAFGEALGSSASGEHGKEDRDVTVELFANSADKEEAEPLIKAFNQYDTEKYLQGQVPDGHYRIQIRMVESLPDDAFMSVPPNSMQILISRTELALHSLNEVASALGHEVIHVGDYKANLITNENITAYRSEVKAYSWQYKHRVPFKLDPSYKQWLATRISEYNSKAGN